MYECIIYYETTSTRTHILLVYQVPGQVRYRSHLIYLTTTPYGTTYLVPGTVPGTTMHLVQHGTWNTWYTYNLVYSFTNSLLHTGIYLYVFIKLKYISLDILERLLIYQRTRYQIRTYMYPSKSIYVVYF